MDIDETFKYAINGTDGTPCRGEFTIQSHVVQDETFYSVAFDHEYWTGGDWDQLRRAEFMPLDSSLRDARAYAEGWLSSWGDADIWEACY
jgi:hypothetical protein